MIHYQSLCNSKHPKNDNLFDLISSACYASEKFGGFEIPVFQRQNLRAVVIPQTNSKRMSLLSFTSDVLEGK